MAWLRSGTFLVGTENTAEEFTISVGKIEQEWWKMCVADEFCNEKKNNNN